MASLKSTAAVIVSTSTGATLTSTLTKLEHYRIGRKSTIFLGEFDSSSQKIIVPLSKDVYAASLTGGMHLLEETK